MFTKSHSQSDLAPQTVPTSKSVSDQKPQKFFVRNAFLKTRDIGLSYGTNHPFGKQNINKTLWALGL